MNIDVIYRMSARAQEAITPEKPEKLVLPSITDPSLIPAVGDLFSLEYLEDLHFVVIQRRFHWASKDHLQLHLDLDLYTEADHWVKTGSST